MPDHILFHPEAVVQDLLVTQAMAEAVPAPPTAVVHQVPEEVQYPPQVPLDHPIPPGHLQVHHHQVHHLVQHHQVDRAEDSFICSDFLRKVSFC